MGAIFSYSISTSIILASLYLAYRWSMANERQFKLNRVTLYMIYVLSIISPIGFGAATATSSYERTGQPFVDIDMSGITTGLIIEDTSIWINVLLWIYMAGVIFTSFRLCWSIIKIFNIINEGTKIVTHEKCHLVVSSKRNLSPFSFLTYIVIPEEDYVSSFSTILLHESTHLRKQHSIDLLIANFVAIFQWYNPAAWLMIEEFKTLHEYQADDSVISAGTDIKKYQYLLIEKAVGERLPSPANSLNHSKLKKRVTMMYKSKPRPLRRMASLATVPALCAGIALVNTPAIADVLSETKSVSMFSDRSYQPIDVETFGESREDMTETADKVTTLSVDMENNSDEKINLSDQTGKVTDSEEKPDDNKFASIKFSEPEADTKASSQAAKSVSAEKSQTDDDDETFVAVEKIAEYPGGMSELMKFLSNNIRYPENSFKNDIQGRVIVKFIIAQNGKVESPTVVRGVDPELDEEAIRVVKEMPAWIPAENNGKPVASWFNLPINFKIQQDKDENEKTE